MKPLHGIFTKVPRRYDLINYIITLGMDRQWRFKTVKECLSSKPKNAIDLACGTADLAINLASLADNEVEVMAVDYSLPMLNVALKKTEQLAPGKNVSFVYGDATKLPFPDGSIDCIGISFAFRNLTYKNPLARRYLVEVFRVLNDDGGRFVIVETSQPPGTFVRKFFHMYLKFFVLPAGYLLSGNKKAYRYLVNSATNYYNPEQVREILLSTGFSRVKHLPLLFGAIAIYTAIKQERKHT